MKKSIAVFSCFDGISCGQLALERAGVKVSEYYSSEISKHAIKVTQKNYPDTIQVGNIEKVKKKEFSKIDLLIGGSPCQGFSMQGNRLNFDDSRSKLFFEFVRLLEEIKPKYFLLENVKMKPAWENIISSYLKVLPYEIDSALVSQQTRKRLYWTNIPIKFYPRDKKLFFDKYLYTRPHGLGFIKEDIRFFRKFPTLTTHAISDYKIVTDLENMGMRKITIEECELLQTVPLGYTNILSDNQACEVLGNGWTIDIIAHIFSFLNRKKINQNIELRDDEIF